MATARLGKLIVNEYSFSDILGRLIFPVNVWACMFLSRKNVTCTLELINDECCLNNTNCPRFHAECNDVQGHEGESCYLDFRQIGWIYWVLVIGFFCGLYTWVFCYENVQILLACHGPDVLNEMSELGSDSPLSSSYTHLADDGS